MIRPLLLALALLAPSAAYAQTAPPPPASDAPQAATPPYVGGDAAGGGRYGRMNMSPEMQKARRAMMQSCSADFSKFCGDSEQGGGGRMQCLRTHGADLSEGCRTAMQSWRAARAAAAPQG